MKSQAKKSGAYKGNKCLECLVKCLQCYAFCFDKCIRFLNKNAYIQVYFMNSPNFNSIFCKKDSNSRKKLLLSS